MKIGNSTDGVNKPDAIGPSTRRSGTASGAPVSAAEPNDRIDLSEATRSLAGASGTASGDEIRPDKVQQMKDAIERGVYQVDAHAVAVKMIDESAHLLERIAMPPGEGKPTDAGK